MMLVVDSRVLFPYPSSNGCYVNTEEEMLRNLSVDVSIPFF